jgi:hypothetical protein
MSEQLFRFQPRWKEELLVSGSGGSFVLDMPMGVSSVNCPSETTWRECAPDWAQSLWPDLHRELEDWCAENGTDLYVYHSAPVYGFERA